MCDSYGFRACRTHELPAPRTTPFDKTRGYRDTSLLVLQAGKLVPINDMFVIAILMDRCNLRCSIFEQAHRL